MPSLYDSIGSTYGETRRADPQISQALAKYVQAQGDASFLDIGCGTGNYTCALANLGGRWHGLDISRSMLDQARLKNTEVAWQLGCVDALPYFDNTFDGIVCTLAIHHFPRLDRSFLEAFRVLRSGTFVLFTAFPEQMKNYWLCHYFPQMMARSIEQMPSKAVVVSALVAAGFAIQDVVPFRITNELQDLFLYSGKMRPQLYLESSVRANISSFAKLCSSAELGYGVERLRADIATGYIAEVVRRYSKLTGDYAYVIASKAEG